ncbi:MAG: amidohydrolase family protein [Verrucomicrobiaceae bacterium]|nr:MAG: amidohydrolase family protein [Verrucomicrobiaceae bacterium]
MKRHSLLLVALLLTLVGYVISAETKTDGKSRTIVFKGATVVDGTGKEPVKADLVVRDGKIESVAVSVAVPEGAEVVDATGKTIIPALISAHSHLGLIKGPKAASANVTEENVRRQLKQYARYGIGTVTSLGADGDFIYKLRDERNNDAGAGARVFTAGLGFGVAGGAPPAAAGLDQVHRPATAEEASAQVNELAKLRPDFVKIWIDDFNGSMPIKMSREVRRAIISEAHKQGLRVAAHVYYISDARELVSEGIDVLAHSIRDQPVDDELVTAMKEKGTFYIATLFLDEAFFAYADQPEWMKGDFFRNALEPGVADLLKPDVFKPKPGSREILQLASRNVKKLHDGGVKIGFGTDSGANPYRVQGFAEHRELQLMVAAGLTPSEAIRAATRTNAELLGVSDRTGTLEPGKQASFLILDDDPLEDIRNTEKIRAVWLDGKLQE